jgi:hypothetical protein
MVVHEATPLMFDFCTWSRLDLRQVQTMRREQFANLGSNDLDYEISAYLPLILPQSAW